MLTKDERSDLQSLIAMVVHRARELDVAKRAKEEADIKLDAFLWEQEQDAKTAEALKTTTQPKGNTSPEATQ